MALPRKLYQQQQGSGRGGNRSRASRSGGGGGSGGKWNLDAHGSGFSACMELPCLSWGLTLAAGVAGWAGTGMALLGIQAVLLLVGGEACIFHAAWYLRALISFASPRGEGPDGLCGCPESWSTHGWVGI